jgi:hypothetical protein
MWFTQGIHIVSCSFGLLSIRPQGGCKFFIRIKNHMWFIIEYEVVKPLNTQIQVFCHLQNKSYKRVARSLQNYKLVNKPKCLSVKPLLIGA